MKVRNGNYTIYNSKICELIEQRYESPIPKNELRCSICYYSFEKYDFEGFKKHPFEDCYCKSFYFTEVSNAFHVSTYALYRGKIFSVTLYGPDPRVLHLYTEDKISLEEFSFSYSYRGGQDCHGYIPIHEITKIWEERGPSRYDVPMPPKLVLYEELEVTDSISIDSYLFHNYIQES